MEIVQVNQASMLEAINRSEIDMQIATAKQYPRNVERSLDNIVSLACMDEQTAASCFYHLEREDRNGKITNIDGLSVRMTEIIAMQWGNLRAQARILGDDGKFLTAQGVCHDLETNVAVSVEVRTRITYKNGSTYNDDMKMTAGNAACAKAFRNAVLKVVPKAVTAKAIQQIQQKAIANVNSDLANTVAQWIEFFKAQNVSVQNIFRYLGVTKQEDITAEMTLKLQAVYTAVLEGTTTYDAEFNQPQQIQAEADKAKARATAAKAKAQAAMDAQQAQQ